ncbi:MAG: hypothetical protein GY835_21095 [bacterium]|nr:hypothetical protein [bacterium]
MISRNFAIALTLVALLLTAAAGWADTAVFEQGASFSSSLSGGSLKEFRQGTGVYAWTRKQPEPQGKTGIEEKPEGQVSLIQALWRSAVVPGWGEMYLGANRRGGIFFGTEVGIWGTWSTFKIQEHLRKSNYIEMARNTAAVASDDHDSDYWKYVGLHLSSQEFNEWLRTYAKSEFGFGTSEYTAYIDDHEISEANGWVWNSTARMRDFAYKRQASLDAGRRATYTLYACLINRVVSMIDVWRLSRVYNEIAVETAGEYAGFDVRVVPDEVGLGMSFGWFKNF